LRLVLPQISWPQAVVATLLIRFCTLWFGVGVGVVSLLLFRRRLAVQTLDGPGAAAPREPRVAPHP
jgi:uncharacterized membrane protein YbhN (UPF0104 family)